MSGGGDACRDVGVDAAQSMGTPDTHSRPSAFSRNSTSSVAESAEGIDASARRSLTAPAARRASRLRVSPGPTSRSTPLVSVSSTRTPSANRTGSLS